MIQVGEWRLLRWKEVRRKGLLAGAYARGDNFNLTQPADGDMAIEAVWGKEKETVCALPIAARGLTADEDSAIARKLLIEAHIAKAFKRMLMVEEMYKEGKWERVPQAYGPDRVGRGILDKEAIPARAIAKREGFFRYIWNAVKAEFRGDREAV